MTIKTPADGRALSDDEPLAATLLPEAARRALEEAAARRRKTETDHALEIGGRGGLDPVRFGDWEVKGLASDF